MKAIRQRLDGILYSSGGRGALLLTGAEAGQPVYLRYALLEQGTENQLLPAVLLDDWGKEIKSLALYEWIREHGLHFPRAELFGFDLSGRSVQYFLRDLELHTKYPCYAYATADTPLTEGVPVEAILVADDLVERLQRTKRPAEVEPPLRNARVSWWRINPSLLRAFDLSLLDEGYHP